MVGWVKVYFTPILDRAKPDYIWLLLETGVGLAEFWLKLSLPCLGPIKTQLGLNLIKPEVSLTHTVYFLRPYMLGFGPAWPKWHPYSSPFRMERYHTSLYPIISSLNWPITTQHKNLCMTEGNLMNTPSFDMCIYQDTLHQTSRVDSYWHTIYGVRSLHLDQK